jgi:D-cysteine desulfhydrase
VGLVLATEELASQLGDLKVEPDAVVVATGSGGACAGIAVGTAMCGGNWTVVGASVSRPLEEAERQVAELVDGCAAVLDVPPPTSAPRLIDALGPGFGMPSREGEAAARIALRTEGMVLDPVYTAKALAVLLDLAGEGDGGPLVFWHTGGLLAAAAHLVASTETGWPA